MRPDYIVSWVKDNPLETGVNTNILAAISVLADIFTPEENEFIAYL